MEYLIRIETFLGTADVLFPDAVWDEPSETSVKGQKSAKSALDYFIEQYGVGVGGVRFSLDVCSPIDLVRALQINDSYHQNPSIVSWQIVSGDIPGDDR